jgi:hypothetical protein
MDWPNREGTEARIPIYGVSRWTLVERILVAIPANRPVAARGGGLSNRSSGRRGASPVAIKNLNNRI